MSSKVGPQLLKRLVWARGSRPFQTQCPKFVIITEPAEVVVSIRESGLVIRTWQQALPDSSAWAVRQRQLGKARENCTYAVRTLTCWVTGRPQEGGLPGLGESGDLPSLPRKIPGF